MSLLAILKENAEACRNYIRLEDLEPGTYEIKRFSLRDTKFGKRLVIDINLGFLYLPEKMTRKFNTDAAIAKLNKKHYDFVYNGNNDEAQRFTFELHPEDDDVETSYCSDGSTTDNENSILDLGLGKKKSAGVANKKK